MSELLIDDDWRDTDSLFAPVVNGEEKGRGQEPRDYSVQPVEMFAPPSQLPLIPRSEWSARIKEMEETKSRLSDVILAAGIPSMDQGSNGYCHTADTEVLTDRGWKAWPDYNYSDLLATVNAAGVMEFQAPFQKHVYDYDGEMIYSTNRRLDFGVTPDHRMLLRKWDEGKSTLSDQYTFHRAADIGWYAGVMNAPRGFIGTELVEVEIEGDRRYDGDDFVAMISLIVSDGFAAKYERSGNLVSFASFRPECRDRVAALASRLGFREQPSRPGVWNRWGAGALADWLFANCYTGGGFKAQHKKVPDIIKVASRRQIEIFLAWNGDQNHKREAHGEHYYSASKRMIDDLQELCLRVGRRGTITKREPRTGVMPQGIVSTSREAWELVVSRTDRLCIERKKHIELDRYKGPVYCAAVPNGTLITRRNGSVLISGNCWGHSTVGCAQASRAIANQPYVPLSAYMVCAIIKRGRNEGGWCGLSAQFLREHGVCSQKLWPQGNRSLSLDTPEARANAALHKTTDEWVDLGRSVYDQNLTFDQVFTCLLMRIPVAGDFNWWSHSVMLCDPVEVEPDSFGIRMRNSWSDSWGEKGFSILRGSKANTNGALAIVTTGMSPI